MSMNKLINKSVPINYLGKSVSPQVTSGRGFGPWTLCQEIWVQFLEMGTDKLKGKPDEMLGGNHVMEKHPIQGRVVTVLVTSCYRN